MTKIGFKTSVIAVQYCGEVQNDDRAISDATDFQSLFLVGAFS